MRLMSSSELVSGQNGIYAAQVLAEQYPDIVAQVCPPEDVQVLVAGPEHENYWDVVDDIDGQEVVLDGIDFILEFAEGDIIVTPACDLEEPDLYVCADCHPALTNGDLSHLDLYDNADERAEEVEEGMRFLGSVAHAGDHHDLEFSHRECDCCGSNLSGSRYGYRYLN